MCQRKSWNVLLAGCGDSAGTTGTKTEVQENNTSEDVVEPVGEVTTFTLPDGPEESDIFVQPVADISDDFTGEWMHPRFFLWKTVGLCIMATMEKSRMCLRHLRSPESIISACV